MKKDEKFYLDYKKLALKYVSSNRTIYDFVKKNTKKTIFPAIEPTLKDLEVLLVELQIEMKEAAANKEKIIKNNKDEKKLNRGNISNFVLRFLFG